MNFVETTTTICTTPRTTTDEATERADASTTRRTCGKTIGVSFLLTVATFSFTQLGLITTSNWVTDTYVIPRIHAQYQNDLRTPLWQHTPEADAVETTSAR